MMFPVSTILDRQLSKDGTLSQTKGVCLRLASCFRHLVWILFSHICIPLGARTERVAVLPCRHHRARHSGYPRLLQCHGVYRVDLLQFAGPDPATGFVSVLFQGVCTSPRRGQGCMIACCCRWRPALSHRLPCPPLPGPSRYPIVWASTD